MNLIEQFLGYIGRRDCDQLALDKIKISKPVSLTIIPNMVNTSVNLRSSISDINIKYSRRNISDIVKFTNSALSIINKDKEKLKRYLEEVYDIYLELKEFSIVKNVLVIEPLCYLYVGKVAMKASRDVLAFNVKYKDYCKIETILTNGELNILFETLVDAIDDFKYLNVGNVNSLFLFDIQEKRIELTLADHTKIILSTEL